MVIEDGELKFKDITQPYGFVDLNAKVWFQKFMDDGVEHEYLMTEGYVWSGRYPEVQRVIEKGNNQSMELDNKSLKGTWSKDDNGNYEFFIINEAMISALCILGEDVEPCFEGASISKVQFSLEEDFKTKLFSMITEIKEILSKGGEPVDEIKETVVTPEVEFSAPEEETTVVETPEVVEEATVTEEFTVVEADTEAEEVVEEVAEEEAAEETEAQVEEEEETETDAPEATDYSAAFTELFNEHEALKAEYAALKEEVDSLREYKNSIERSEKEELINKFYMLSEDDKKDVMDNIDSYSLEEIEAKLCVACYRKGLGFENKTEESEEVKTYNLQVQDATPAWIKAVEERSKK